MNGMKKSTYLVLVLALFVIEDIYHAWGWGGVNEGVHGGEEQLTTPKANYHISTLSRKLLAFRGYNNNTGSNTDLVPDASPGAGMVSGSNPSFNFGSGPNMGSGSSTDLVPDANPVLGSDPSFKFGPGPNMGSGTDLVPDANPVSGSDPSFKFRSGPNIGSGSSTDLVPDANPRSGWAGPGTGSTFRIGPGGPGCSKYDIAVDQGATGPLPNGIPTYTVIITNTCAAGTGGSCTFSDIHLSCGWFSSFILVDPDVFRRIGYDDCLLKNGGNLNPNEVVSFVYADTFAYPLSVTSVTC